MSKDDASIAGGLASVVAEELVGLRSFVEVLKKEQQALIDSDIEQLTQLVSGKTQLSTRLEQFAERRRQILSGVSVSPDKEGMERWLTQTQSGLDNWNALLKLAAEAHELNKTNGTLIATRLQHNQQALSVLLAASNQAALYGPDGQTQSKAGGRLFGAA